MIQTVSTASTLALAIHTASPELGLALSDFAEEERCQMWDLGRSLSTHLHTHLNDFIQPYTWADFKFIAVAKGPGGFTGTRMGVVTARTLAQQLDIPLFTVSTLAAIAWSNSVMQINSCSEGKRSPHVNSVAELDAAELDETDIAVEMPAQRGEIHAAIYSIQPIRSSQSSETALVNAELTALFPDSVLTQERWQRLLETWHKPYKLIQAEQNLGSSVTAVLQLAYQDWQQGIRPRWDVALPFYGQSPV